jgi:hypothetical protein
MAGGVKSTLATPPASIGGFGEEPHRGLTPREIAR